MTVTPLRRPPIRASLSDHRASGLAGWTCSCCGACIDDCWAEGLDRRRRVFVCSRCIDRGDIDVLLAKHADELEAEARWTRELIGRLRVPTGRELHERLFEVGCQVYGGALPYTVEELTAGIVSELAAECDRTGPWREVRNAWLLEHGMSQHAIDAVVSALAQRDAEIPF
jgi:hypothetical protein